MLSPRSESRCSAVNDERPRAAITDAAVDTLTSLPYEAWHFGDSIAFEAGISAAAQLGRSDVSGFLRGFARGWAARRDGFVELDATAPGLALVHLANAADDNILRDTTIALAEFLTQRPTVGNAYQTWEQSPLRQPYGNSTLTDEDARLLADPGPGVFVDCLHFDPPFFAALHRNTGAECWANEALSQALAYVSLLQDPNTGLFWHFHLRNSGRPHMLGWGRGQGWALLGMLDVIEQLGVERASELVEPVQRVIRAMCERQLPTGSWTAVAGAPESGSESSTAAFMAYGFRRAVQLGLVRADEVEEAIRRARCATIKQTTNCGVLEGVSEAVGASTVDSHYHHVPPGPATPWGQGPLVLTLLDALNTPPT